MRIPEIKDLARYFAKRVEDRITREQPAITQKEIERVGECFKTAVIKQLQKAYKLPNQI